MRLAVFGVAGVLALTACTSSGSHDGDGAGSADAVGKLSHAAVELHVERQFQTPMTECNGGRDIAVKRAGQTFMCDNALGEYTVTITDAAAKSYTVAITKGSENAAPGSGNAISTQGSVTTKDGSFIQYPNGAVVRIAKAAVADRGRCPDVKKQQTCVYVRLALNNIGSKPIQLESGIGFTLFYGENEYEADEDAGYMGDAGLTTFPQRCVPRSTVTNGELFDVPNNEMGQLAVMIEGDLAGNVNYSPYTFTNVQTLLN